MTFTDRVYEIVKEIPPGKVATYKDVAVMAGNPGAARAVGMAMSHNPSSDVVPCHRVVGSDGSLHGYAFGGQPAKLQHLLDEGVEFIDGRVDMSKYRWTPRLS